MRKVTFTINDELHAKAVFVCRSCGFNTIGEMAKYFTACHVNSQLNPIISPKPKTPRYKPPKYRLRRVLSVQEYRDRVSAEANWFSVKKQVLERDDFTCQHCGRTTADVHVHHKIKRRLGGNDTLENLITLCPTCHKEADNGEIAV